MIIELSLFQRNLISKGAMSIDRLRKDEYRESARKLVQEKIMISPEERDKYLQPTEGGVYFPPVKKPIDLEREEVLLINRILSSERFINSEEDFIVEIEKILDQALGKAAA